LPTGSLSKKHVPAVFTAQLPEATSKIAPGGGDGGGAVHETVTDARAGVDPRSILLTTTVNGTVNACVNVWPLASSASKSEKVKLIDDGGLDWIVTSFWPSRVPPLDRSSRFSPTKYSSGLPTSTLRYTLSPATPMPASIGLIKS